MNSDEIKNENDNEVEDTKEDTVKGEPEDKAKGEPEDTAKKADSELELKLALDVNEIMRDMEENEEPRIEAVKPTKRKKWPYILLGIEILILGLCVGGYNYAKHYVKTKFINNINKIEDRTLGQQEIEEIRSEAEAETEPSEDNIDDVMKNLIEGDAKSFFEQGEITHDNYVKNILLIGTDVRVSDSWNGNSDSVILISINRKKKKIAMTSFMRDSYIYIPEVDMCNKLNFAHASGGGALLTKTIEGNFKVHIDGFMRVDFYSMMEIVDTIGGVDMELIPDELPVANKYISEMADHVPGCNAEENYLTEAGYVHLNGIQAVAYARIRYVGNADYERTNRQRKILAEIFKECKTMSVSEIQKFATDVLPKIATNMESEEIWDIVKSAISYLKYDVVSERVPFDDASHSEMINGQSSLVLDMKKNVELLLDTIYN